MTDEEEKKQSMRQMGTFITLPFVLAIPPILGWGIGYFLDKNLGTAPYLSYFLLILGFASGGIEFYRIIKKYGNTE